MRNNGGEHKNDIEDNEESVKEISERDKHKNDKDRS